MELLKIIFIGIVEGITEWLPVSSTGHMILVDRFMPLNMTPEFKSVFLVVIQLGAILAVVQTFFDRLQPFKKKDGQLMLSGKKLSMWGKIIVSCVPAAIIGIAFDDWIDAHLYNAYTVAVALIVFGGLFLWIENRPRVASTRHIEQISYKDAIVIGLWQVLAAVFPGTSRSGATIIGGLTRGLDRVVATEFTFFLAVPVMFGASLLKLVKYRHFLTGSGLLSLAVGMIVAYAVSQWTIRGLINFVKKHDFKGFGYYRIALGLVVLLVQWLIKI